MPNDILSGLDPGAIQQFLASLNLPQLDQGGVVPYGDLADKLNKFMTEQVRAPYIANLPGYQGNLDQAVANTSDLLKGNISRGALDQLSRAAAERGIGIGSPNSPNMMANYMTTVGRTAEANQKEGLANLHQLIADTPIPQVFNPASLFVPEHLSANELAAALAGRQTGPGTTTPPFNTGGGGGLTLPGGHLNDEPLGPGSWERPGSPILSGPQNTIAPNNDYFSEANMRARLHNQLMNRSDPFAVSRQDAWNTTGGTIGPANDWARQMMQDVNQGQQQIDFETYLRNFGMGLDTQGPNVTSSVNPFLGPDMDFWRQAQTPSVTPQDIWSGGTRDIIGGLGSYDRFFGPSGGFDPGSIFSGGGATNGYLYDDTGSGLTGDDMWDFLG